MQVITSDILILVSNRPQKNLTKQKQTHQHTHRLLCCSFSVASLFDRCCVLSSRSLLCLSGFVALLSHILSLSPSLRALPHSLLSRFLFVRHICIGVYKKKTFSNYNIKHN
uniref:(northern house mosquito) hypothetical protein n=1 Tax=Culex pipiens TaxID=7175 RepID=A0A8D8N732_CULPI